MLQDEFKVLETKWSRMMWDRALRYISCGENKNKSGPTILPFIPSPQLSVLLPSLGSYGVLWGVYVWISGYSMDILGL